MSHDIKSAERPAPDHILTAIADYALSVEIKSELAYETAGYCLMDTLACGFQALKYPACTKLMGPVVPGATLAGGARVPGTSYELDPINALAVEKRMATDSALAGECERVGALQRLMRQHLPRESAPPSLRMRVETAVSIRRPPARFTHTQFSWRALAAPIPARRSSTPTAAASSGRAGRR